MKPWKAKSNNNNIKTIRGIPVAQLVEQRFELDLSPFAAVVPLLSHPVFCHLSKLSYLIKPWKGKKKDI